MSQPESDLEVTPPHRGWRHALISPTSVVALASLLVILLTLAGAGWDPLTFVQIGTQYSEGNPSGTQGYDGQFVYYIARDPNPAAVAPYLDVPAYRYQRILLPLLGWLGCAAARCDTLPFDGLAWLLPFLVLLSHIVGTYAVQQLLVHLRVNRWYALVYGLWVGFILAIRLDLSEPLAYGLIAWALLLEHRSSSSRAGSSSTPIEPGANPGQPKALPSATNLLISILYSLAFFAKEVAGIFVLARWGLYLWRRQWREAALFFAIAILPFILFQFWLAGVFGQPGIGSGGAMGTPFEWIPYMGLWRIGAYSLFYLLAYSIVFIPAIVIPSLWGIYRGLRDWFSGMQDLPAALLLANCAIIPFLPFSTFRETGGLLRFTCGMVFAILFYAAHRRKQRILNYTFLWVVLLVFMMIS